ncbi:hypothetical protein HDIA_0736 [Hartmannibacter diazotrophicus]|uniref:Uncharacterized protein n=1 Tax=Hartmannibacter diazotrophicus TaxID=1482074 RepID=A0A2C9D1N1_9HYPH|nr:hypothetical protein [Hartmannibacter diazotrophicus]SON54277.1 hypothetical protein HDIA_0736 [Hartmannibacter diazotrophicus]
MSIVKKLSSASRAPGAPAILGEAAQEIIRQDEEIKRLRQALERIRDDDQLGWDLVNDCPLEAPYFAGQVLNDPNAS